MAAEREAGPREKLADARSFGDFAPIKTVGTGTFGRVLLCRLRSTRDVCAIKVLRKADVIRLRQVEHLVSEKMILEQLDHPFIVKLYASFQDARNLYMNLEFVVGGELFSFLSAYQNFPPEIARFFAAEIVSVLEYLHKKQIVYRDLKPENVLIDQYGHIKICDFGFAKFLDDRTYTVCGTMDYLSPEIIKKKGHGFGVDFWALGVIIFEMITGYPPFDDDNPIGVCSKILNGDVTYPDFMDEATVSVIRGLLTEDLTQRLGCTVGGFRDLMLHPFFESIDWHKCYERKLRPPFRPNIVGADDTQNFPEYDEVDVLTLEEVDLALTDDEQRLFAEFSIIRIPPAVPPPGPPDFSAR